MIISASCNLPESGPPPAQDGVAEKVSVEPSDETTIVEMFTAQVTPAAVNSMRPGPGKGGIPDPLTVKFAADPRVKLVGVKLESVVMCVPGGVGENEAMIALHGERKVRKVDHIAPDRRDQYAVEQHPDKAWKHASANRLDRPAAVGGEPKIGRRVGTEASSELIRLARGSAEVRRGWPSGDCSDSGRSRKGRGRGCGTGSRRPPASSTGDPSGPHRVGWSSR
jgi:hypothetical protein